MSAPSDTWLRKVQALLAKAESTEFPAEAETLLAKAQELMARHAIDEAMLQQAGAARRDEIVSETVIVDPPYASARSALLGAVARANDCRLVMARSGRGAQHCVLVGHRSDVDGSITLFAALSVHATRSMLAEPVPPYDTPRRFRHAFVLAYASRIAERLQAATRAARAEAERTIGTSVSVVLADRSHAVDDAFAELFPHTRPARRMSSSMAGHRSGRAAADRADVGQTAVRGTRGDLAAG
jgi:hypothetical protein